MRRKLLYITSPSYSGSTLLTILLGAQRQVATVGELKASAFGNIQQYQCSCGRLLRKCPFWLHIADIMQTKTNSFDLHHWKTHFTAESFLTRRLLESTLQQKLIEKLRSMLIHNHRTSRQTYQEIVNINAQLVESVCQTLQKPVFLDASKDPVRARFLESSGLWEMYLIILVRDGRGTVNSHMRRTGATVKQAAMLWRKKIREINKLSDWFSPDRVTTIKYEDLCKDPGEVISEICAFADLDYRPPDLPLVPEGRHIFGNNMRMVTVSEIRHDTRWHQSLSQSQIRTFEAVAGSENANYGATGDDRSS